MQEDTESIQLLLISPSPARAELLSRTLAQHELKTELSVMRPSKNAVACVRRTGRFRCHAPFDVVLLDLAAMDRDMLCVVAAIAFGPDRVPTPTVLLTDDKAEEILDSGRLQTGDLVMFAPTSLPSFLNKMRQHSPGKFLQALSKLSGIGPVLVRLPRHFTRALDELPQQQIGLIAA
jgi:CheY-like chemotaxis protein